MANPQYTHYSTNFGPGHTAVDFEIGVIPDATLDHVLKNALNFNDFDVYYNEEDAMPFFDNMIDHPRFNEFMDAEVDKIFDNVERTNSDPRVFEKFKKSITRRMAEEFGITGDTFEEFLHFTQSKKSARNCAEIATHPV